MPTRNQDFLKLESFFTYLISKVEKWKSMEVIYVYYIYHVLCFNVTYMIWIAFLRVYSCLLFKSFVLSIFFLCIYTVYSIICVLCFGHLWFLCILYYRLSKRVTFGVVCLLVFFLNISNCMLVGVYFQPLERWSSRFA